MEATMNYFPDSVMLKNAAIRAQHEWPVASWQLCITLRTLEAAHYSQGGDEIPGLALGAHRTLTGALSEEMEIS